jgi:hypothetical protein
MIDKELFNDLQELYKTNIEEFKKNRTALIIGKIHPLLLENVEKAIDVEDCLVDKKYIMQHYVNFTINPQITEEKNFKNGQTYEVEISPDISWDMKK